MRKLLATLIALFVLSGCYNNKYDKLYPATTAPTVCDTTTITYSNDIQPIITQNCTVSGGCHDVAGSAISGFNYQTTIVPLQTEAANGNLLGDINWLPHYNQMPKNANKLADCDIAKITRWVDEGAPNN